MCSKLYNQITAYSAGSENHKVAALKIKNNL